MSHRALQRALVTALHDDGFVARFHADPDGVLAPLGLGDVERRQLLAVDRRAFRTDPLRRRRILRVLAEEYKGATTLALAETRSYAFAEGFFGTTFFQRAIFDDAPLALAFGDWLVDAAESGRLTTPPLADVARLERTTARCRREARREETSARTSYALAPGVAVGRFDGGVLETLQRIERYLFELGLMPQLALCDDRPPLPALPTVGELEPLHLLFTPSANGVGLAPVDEDLFRVLSTLATPRAPGELVGALGSCGVPAGAVTGLVRSLVDEGLLVAPPA